MTARSAEVVQVLGRARAGDAVTATARSLQVRLTRLGWTSRTTAADPGSLSEVQRFSGAEPGHLVVHSVDGGDGLADLVGSLRAHRITLVHHGSAAGSDRGVLRTLRGSTGRALAADPAAREELRALGFADVGVLDPSTADDAFAGVVADEQTVASLAAHPGPLVVGLGALAPGGWTETLLAAFAAVLTHTHPSAVLALCGPSSRWYRAQLHRHVVRRGLVACDLGPPEHDGEVLARLERASAVVSLRPTALDPYGRRAAHLGLPIVAPLVTGAAALAEVLEPVPVAPDPRTLAEALRRALDRPRPAASAGEDEPAATMRSDPDLAAALGLR
jgi:hypothetical protein